VVFLEFFPHVGDERLDLALEIRVQVGHDAADDVVILNEASPRGFFKDVHDFFTVAHPIDKGRQRAHVHTHGGPGQQVGGHTGQFIHDGADHVNPVGYLNAGRLFNAHAQRMAIDVGREVIKPVGKVQDLGIGQSFT